MPLTLTCTKCNQKLAIADELKGKQVQCPTCNEIYVVERKKPPVKPAVQDDIRPAIAVAPPDKTKSVRPTKSTPASRITPTKSPVPIPNPSPSNTSRKSTAGKPQPPTTDPDIATCPSCDAKMRRPVAPGITTFLCPSCGATVHIAAPEIDVSVPPKPAPMDEDPFADLGTPPSPDPASFHSVGNSGPNAMAGPRPRSSPSLRTRSSGTSGPARAGSSRLLGPGLLIAIPYSVAILSTIGLLITHVTRDQTPLSTQSYNATVVVLGVLLINFVLVLLGSLRLVFGSGTIIAALTCIAALSPTIMFSGLGLFFYPFAIGGGIWGIIALALGHSSNDGTPTLVGSSPSSTSSATDYLRNARAEMDREPADDVPESGLKATGFVIAGIALLCFACYHAYLFFQHTNGQIELRRPGRAISGAVISVITGFGLLARGLSFFR